MGRPKGSKNTKDRLEKFLLGVFSEVNPEAFGRELLRSTDEKVRTQVYLRLLEYKFGKPSQPITGEGGGPISVQLVTNVTFPET